MTPEERRFYIHRKYGVDTDKRSEKPKYGKLLFDGQTVAAGDFAKLGHIRNNFIRKGYSKDRLKITYL